jgi:hypothetical protein
MSRCYRVCYYLRTWLAVHSLCLWLGAFPMLSPAVGVLWVSVASADPPIVNAGPSRVLAFPAKDLTLFGYATAPKADALTVQWSMTSGPAPVTFSAPAALTTTVTFTTTGAYVFQLAASDGTSTGTGTVQITVKPASSQTSFYVDPTFIGVGNGTAQAPWKSFEDGNPYQAAQWSTINRALARNDVIVYFSARQAGSDIAEQILGAVRVMRTNKSAHRLTLDGMSKYNTNDASPSWADYTGSNKMRLKMSSGCCFSIGWDDDVQRDYITIRGFEVTGSGARIRWGGSSSVLEYIWSYDVTGLGATVQFNAAVSDYPACKDLGKAHEITVRNNLIERGIGEGIYLAGNYLLTADGGCPSYGNTHSDILIEGNIIRDPGINGEQGDGIDLKAGLMNVTVRDNVIQNMHTSDEGGDGITALGVFAPAPTHYLIERNRIFHGPGHGMILLAQNGSVVRNNLIYNMGGTGIYLAGDRTFPNKAVDVYNNTLSKNRAPGVGLDNTHRVRIKNNLFLGNNVRHGGNQLAHADSTSITSDYNLFAPTRGSVPEGTHSIVHTSTRGIVGNPATGDFHLVSQSPAIDNAVSLARTGFSTDRDGISRPQGTAWDVGAYEFSSEQRAPGSLQNFRIMGGD